MKLNPRVGQIYTVKGGRVPQFFGGAMLLAEVGERLVITSVTDDVVQFNGYSMGRDNFTDEWFILFG